MAYPPGASIARRVQLKIHDIQARRIRAVYGLSKLSIWPQRIFCFGLSTLAGNFAGQTQF